MLDVLVHLPDLPVLGFGKDKKIGLSLWKYPKFAFVFEYSFFAAGVLSFTADHLWASLLIAGGALHALNANSFFGFTKFNPTKTPNLYATLALVGFAIAIGVFHFILR